MVEERIVSLVVNLTATGITAATTRSISKVREVLRRRRFSEDLNEIATEFATALESAIQSENKRREINELEGILDDWDEIIETLAGINSNSHEIQRESEQFDFLFKNEEAAVARIAEAIATVNGLDLTEKPDLRDALETSLTRAYREAIAEFERRLAGTERADIFEAEMNLVITEELNNLQSRLGDLNNKIETILSQPAKNEGFRQLTPNEFARGPDPQPEKSWRIGFTINDVRAGIPAEREAIDTDGPASREIFDYLRGGDNRIIVGRAGAGKSTLAKQVAVRWYRSDETGSVLYRESGSGGGSRFTSTDSLKRAITATKDHTLVVVEDAVRPASETIFEVVEDLLNYDSVSFLLDSRRSELKEFNGGGAIEANVHARRAELADSMPRYPLPRISETEVKFVVNSFEESTGKPIERSSSALYEEILPGTKMEMDIGGMVLLSFLLPVGEENVTSGLERHVRNRYETLLPDSETAIRDLSAYESELLADVGIMVTTLNATGIGIHPELVHSLCIEYGHDVETHDEITDILSALEDWFLYPIATCNENETGVQRTTHELWSTLYLRELAQEHERNRKASQRRIRSEPRFARCLNCIFTLVHSGPRKKLLEEFPESPLLADIDSAPVKEIEEYMSVVYELGEQWPVLQPLYGTTESSRIDVPNEYNPKLRYEQIFRSGVILRKRGQFERARTELEAALEYLREHDSEIADETRSHCLNEMGSVAQNLGELEAAKEYQQQALEVAEEHGLSLVKMRSLTRLGSIEHDLGQFDEAESHLKQSLAIAKEQRYVFSQARSLNLLGVIEFDRKNAGEAEEYYKKALEKFEQIGSRLEVAKCLGNLCAVSRRQNDFEIAKRRYERVLDLFREAGDEHNVARTLGNLGHAYRESGNREQARHYHQQALEEFKRLGAEIGVARSYRNIGLAYKEDGKLEEAESSFRSALELLSSLGASRISGKTHMRLAEVLNSKGDLSAAKSQYLKAIGDFEDSNAGDDIVSAYEALVNVCGNIGDCTDIVQRMNETISQANSHDEYVDEVEDMLSNLE